MCGRVDTTPPVLNFGTTCRRMLLVILIQRPLYIWRKYTLYSLKVGWVAKTVWILFRKDKTYLSRFCISKCCSPVPARGLVNIDYTVAAPHPNNHDVLMLPIWISCAFKCAASHNLYEYVGNVAELTIAQASSYRGVSYSSVKDRVMWLALSVYNFSVQKY